MNNQSIKSLKIQYWHHGKTPYVTISCLFHGEQISTGMKADDAAALVGVSRQTLHGWAEGSHKPPESALRLFCIVALGLVPWPGFEAVRALCVKDRDGVSHWGLISRQWPKRIHLTPQALAYWAAGHDQAQGMHNEIRMLRATVNALSTRQKPPIPCAEIIPIEHYRRP